MSSTWIRGVLAVVVLAACAMGCSGTLASMQEVGPAPRLERGTARIVFVRPSGYASGFAFKLIDIQGQWQGDIQAESKLTIDVRPGKHIYVLWAENTDAIEIVAAAGRTYYVEVASKMGVWAGPRCHLLALTPQSDNWSRLGEWLERTKEYVPRDEWRAQREVPAEIAERLRRGREHLRNYRTKGNADHFIAAEEGIVAAGPAATAARAPASPPAADDVE